MSEIINCLQISISFFCFFTFVTNVSYYFFFKNSQALRGANVQGTQNVLLFACTSKIKPLHYIRYVSFLTSCLNHYSTVMGNSFLDLLRQVKSGCCLLCSTDAVFPHGLSNCSEDADMMQYASQLEDG